MEPEALPADLPIADLPLAPSWLDAGLEALGLPEAMISIPVALACAMAAVTLTEIAKNAARRPEGVDTARWQWTWRGVAVAVGALLGACLSALGRVTLAEGALLGLAGGLAAPVVWRVAIPYLRARGVR